jgi:hypothetical protein
VGSPSPLSEPWGSGQALPGIRVCQAAPCLAEAPPSLPRVEAPRRDPCASRRFVSAISPFLPARRWDGPSRIGHGLGPGPGHSRESGNPMGSMSRVVPRSRWGDAGSGGPVGERFLVGLLFVRADTRKTHPPGARIAPSGCAQPLAANRRWPRSNAGATGAVSPNHRGPLPAPRGPRLPPASRSYAGTREPVPVWLQGDCSTTAQECQTAPGRTGRRARRRRPHETDRVRAAQPASRPGPGLLLIAPRRAAGHVAVAGSHV